MQALFFLSHAKAPSRKEKMNIALEKLFSPLLDFIFPPICPACKKRQESFVHLCPLCQDQLQSTLDMQIHSDASDFTHLDGTQHFDHGITFWKYSDELDHLVQLIKYHGRKKLGRHIGELAGRALRQSGFEKADMIIPVPLHRKRIGTRGYNQSDWIARGLASQTGMHVRPELMIRIKHTRTQTRLDAEARRENVDNAFSVPRPRQISGKTIYILDDVITSGATLNACARTLKENGAKRIIGIGLARPLLRHT